MINVVDKTMADNPEDRQGVEQLKKMIYISNGQINNNLSLEQLKEIKSKIFLLEKDFAKKRIITEGGMIVGYAITDTDAELADLQDEFEDYLLDTKEEDVDGGNSSNLITAIENTPEVNDSDEEYELLAGYREAVNEYQNGSSSGKN